MTNQEYQEPIAIIGMACRLPGDISSPSELWDFLAQGKSAQSDFPSNRLNIDSWYHPDSQRPGSISTKGGYFLGEGDSFRDFDPSFFSISPLEAASMDPQQRKLLEVVYESFESAGLCLGDVSGSNTGCFVGNFTWDIGQAQARDVDYVAPYQMTGGGLTILSNRVNYVFNLKGPSLTLDTACSSTMYALHMACKSLQAGDCSAAVVGGTNLIFGIEQQIGSVKLGTLSPTSTCHTFDASADGYGRAEAVGAIYIKRLSDAIRDQDPIRAVLRATSVNTNGKGPGISHPSTADQEVVIRKAYANAGLDFHDTGYFESHGTGTPVGDPVEFSAIGNIFGPLRREEDPLLVGSVKTNLGHSEAASAIPSLIKVVLSLEKGLIPATVGIKKFNPKLDFRGGALKVVQTLTPWPQDHSYRRASVNSFGYGGANAHAILDAVDSYLNQATKVTPSLWTHATAVNGNGIIRNGNGHVSHSNGHASNGDGHARNGHASNGHASNGHASNGHASNGHASNGHASNGRASNGHASNGHASNGNSSKGDILVGNGTGADEDRPGSAQAGLRTYLLPFSAHNERTLRRNYDAVLKIADKLTASDLVQALSKGRSSLPTRGFAVVTESEDHTVKQLSEATLRVEDVAADVPTIGFVFTGQGAQWPQMGLALIHEYPSVRQTIEQLDDILRGLPHPPQWTIMDTLAAPKSESVIDAAERSQTVCTALQIAVVELLWSWGIASKASVGHSSGEIAAAFAAGHLTSRQAIIIAYLRGQAVSNNNTPGAMLAVGMGSEQALHLLDGTSGVGIACYNSPKSVTLSGTKEAIEEAHGVFARAGAFSRKLVTSGNAYHSPLMARAGEVYDEQLLGSLGGEDATLQNAGEKDAVVMFSSVTGKKLTGPIPLTYWRKNLESKVLFHQAVRALVDDKTLNVDCLVEIGPHSALSGPIKEIRTEIGHSEGQLRYVSALKRNSKGTQTVLDLAGALYLYGYPIDLGRVNALEKSSRGAGSKPFVVDLPPYQWDYEFLHWKESRTSIETRFRAHPRHDLLGSRLAGCSKSSATWRNIVQLDQLPWLRDHKVGQDIVFPAAGYISLAMAAASQAVGLAVEDEAHEYTLRNVKISAAMVLKEGEGVELVVDLRTLNSASSDFDFSVSSVTSAGEWTSHVLGIVSVKKTQHAPVRRAALGSKETQALPDGVNQATQDRRWYQKMGDVGLVYGEAFKTLTNIRATSSQDAVADVGVKIPTGSEIHESWYPIHPTIIDGALQLSIIAAHKGDPNNLVKPYLPVFIEHMTVASPANGPSPENAVIRGQGKPGSLRSIQTTFELISSGGNVILEARVNFMSLENSTEQAQSTVPKPYSRLVWRPDINRVSSQQLDRLLTDNQKTSEAVDALERLEELAALCILDIAATSFGSEIDILPEHIQKFIGWIREQSRLLAHSASGALSKADREERIRQIAEDMTDDIPEAASILRIHGNVADIILGKVELQDLLADDGLLARIRSEGLPSSGVNDKLEKLLQLIAHHDPHLEILDLASGRSIGHTKSILAALHSRDTVPSYITYHVAHPSKETLDSLEKTLEGHQNVQFNHLDIDQDLAAQGLEDGSFDVVFIPNSLPKHRLSEKALQNCKSLLKSGGRLIWIETTKTGLADNLIFGTSPDFWTNGNGVALEAETDRIQRLLEAGFSDDSLVLYDYPEPARRATLIMAISSPSGDSHPATTNGVNGHGDTKGSKSEQVVLLYRNNPHPLTEEIEKLYDERNIPTCRMRFSDLPTQDMRVSRTIMLAELESPLLSDMSEVEMEAMKHYSRVASTAVWVTDSDVLTGQDPEKTLVFGIAKSLMTEQPSFHISSIDFSPSEMAASLAASAQLVVELEERFHENPENLDTELAKKDDVVYISRYIEDEEANAEFAQLVRPEPGKAAARGSLSMHFDKIGDLGSFYFRDTTESTTTELGETQVLVDCRAFALDTAGLEIAKGQKNKPFFTADAGGIVSATGSKVQGLRVGDRVACLKPNNFDTTLRVDQSLCHPLEESERFDDILGQLLPFTFAIHVFRNSFQVGKGDSVLVDVPSISASLAAAQVAASLGATVYATSSSAEQKEALSKIEGLRLIDARDLQEPGALPESSIQVVVTNGSMDLGLSLRRIADRGARIVLCSATITDMSSLSLSLREKNLVINWLDPMDLTSLRLSEVASALKNTFEFIRNNDIKAIPCQAFDLGEFVDAATFVNQTQTRAVLTCSPDATVLPITEAPTDLKLDSNASYLLIGCLGGLGRSLTMFMIAHGARNLIYLSRSGADKAEAASLVKQLEEMSQSRIPDLKIQVVRGDVCKREDVARAIAHAKTPIKGVVQAAMVLHELIFDHLTLTQWNQVIRPKVQGSLHLHSLLQDQDLDFFIMTSSVLGAIGAATQSNYSAANSFLDAMARHRHSLGLQATSVALGMILDVGHVEEHPEVQTALNRNGMYGIGVAEYLHAMERAFRRRDLKAAATRPPAWGYDAAASAHIVTGMDSTRLTRAGGKGMWLGDFRLRNLLHSMDYGKKMDANGGAAGTSASATAAAQLKAAAEEGPDALKLLVTTMIMDKLSKLALLPVEKLSAAKPLAQYGMDSMISAELRNWAWKQFKADIPLMALLDQSLTFEQLAEVVVAGMDREVVST